MHAHLYIVSPGLTAGSSRGTKRARATDIQPPSQSKCRRQGLALAFINTVVTSIDGSTVVMNKRSRKKTLKQGDEKKENLECHRLMLGHLLSCLLSCGMKIRCIALYKLNRRNRR